MIQLQLLKAQALPNPRSCCVVKFSLTNFPTGGTIFGTSGGGYSAWSRSMFNLSPS